MLRWFSNLKIAHKLILGFGLVLLLMLGTLATDAVVSTGQTAVANHLVNHLYPARQAAREIVTLARAADSDAGRYLLELDDQSRAATDLRTYEQEVQQIRRALAQAYTLADTDGQRQNIQAFTTFYFGKGGYYEGSEASFTFKQAGKFSLAFGHFADTPLAPSLHAADLYIVTVEREVAQESAAEDTATSLVLLLSLSLGGLATLLGIGIAILIARSISRPLKQVEHAAQHLCRNDVANLASGLTALARGDLTATIQTNSIPPLYQSRDEIGQTAQAMRSIVADVQRTVDGYEVARLELQQLYGQLAEQNKTLQSLSTTDPLTGLPNHRTVMSRVEEELSRCRRTQTSCAVLFVDLDHFKRINDTWGHQAGDAILREAGRRLSSCLRLEDFVGRYGGEEFAIVLTHTDQGEAHQVAERMRAALAETPCLWQAEEASAAITIPITGSIGVAVFQEHGSTRETLIEAADNAMYFAKHTGRNRVCLAGEEMAVVQEVLAKTGDGQMSDGIAAQALGAVAHVHDRGTSAHARRMVHLVEATARTLARPAEELHLIRLAALLHDIGKIGIPDAILNKPGPLSEEEWAVMSRHPEIGRQVLVQAGGIFVLLSRIVVAHHERWDGNGYPYGLAKEAIPLGARILSVVDAYDAMLSQRPYREAMSDADARAELERCAGSQFDPQVVEAFLQALAAQEQQAEHGQGEAPQPQASTATEGIVTLA